MLPAYETREENLDQQALVQSQSLGHAISSANWRASPKRQHLIEPVD
jgi:hypothetical protein